MPDLHKHLAAEADQARPAFDADLHLRTMNRIEQARRNPAQTTLRAPRPRSPWTAVVMTAGAAAVALLVTISSSNQPVEDEIAHGPQLQPLIDVLAGAGAPFKEAVADPVTDAPSSALALLRDDGARLIEFVVDQVSMRPIAPDEAVDRPTPVPSNPAPRQPA